MISGDITTPFAEDGVGGMFFVTSSGLFHWEDGTTRRFPLHASSDVVPVAVYRDSQQTDLGRYIDRRRATGSSQK